MRSMSCLSAVDCDTDDIIIYNFPLPDIKTYRDISLAGSETPHPAQSRSICNVRCLCHQA